MISLYEQARTKPGKLSPEEQIDVLLEYTGNFCYTMV